MVKEGCEQMGNAHKKIISLCSGTGSWEKPYFENGYDVYHVTLPDNDVLTYVPPENVYGILAAPPCTEFSVLNCIAAARERNECEGMKIVNACLRIINECNPEFWALENPTGYLRQHLGKPKMSFQPWEYGDAWTKKTDIWGNYNIPIKNYKNWDDVPKLNLYTRPNRGKPSIAYLHKSAWKDIPQFSYHKTQTDAEFRAMTAPGFAKAFFEANQ